MEDLISRETNQEILQQFREEMMVTWTRVTVVEVMRNSHTCIFKVWIILSGQDVLGEKRKEITYYSWRFNLSTGYSSVDRIFRGIDLTLKEQKSGLHQ